MKTLFTYQFLVASYKLESFDCFFLAWVATPFSFVRAEENKWKYKVYKNILGHHTFITIVIATEEWLESKKEKKTFSFQEVEKEREAQHKRKRKQKIIIKTKT